MAATRTLEYDDGTGWRTYRLHPGMDPLDFADFHRIGWPNDRLRLREGDRFLEIPSRIPVIFA